MGGTLWPPAACVRALLNIDGSTGSEANSQNNRSTIAWVRTLLKRRLEFGITRVGSITRLDRIGIPVVQVVRPLSLSNSVSQGKGLSVERAAASALMEALETWAGESNPRPEPKRPATDLDPKVGELYAGLVTRHAPKTWNRLPISWVEGWELFSDTSLPVPLPLVDTVYTYPSPHPDIFPRATTGLGGGSSLAYAIVQAGLEILERDAVARAHRQPGFFDRRRVNPDSVRSKLSRDIIDRIVAANLIVGIWHVPAKHALPVYWCHVMEAAKGVELVPLPAEGFGCDFTHDKALARALLEACQARAAAISGAREDITRRAYPEVFDREHLADWRDFLIRPGGAVHPEAPHKERLSWQARLEAVLTGFADAGAKAAAVVPLFVDEDARIFVVRLVAPPLRQHSGH
jgi:ribosomal protein S12 methylthiotransferase accessory factor